MIRGMAGPGGSLGQCVLCGATFLVEILMGKSVHVIEVPGIDGDLAIHERCQDQMTELLGHPWQDLPDGPLRRAYAKAEADGHLVD